MTTKQIAVSINRMGKERKKPNADRHVTPRKPIQMPLDWYLVTFKMASAQKQPTLWYILSRIAEDADAAGIPRPKLPWETEPGK